MASGQTEHYSLNQWQPEDQVLREEFNQDNAKIDAALPRFITGSYVGTGETEITKHYSLGSRPKMVIVRTENTYSGNTYDRGLLLTEAACIFFNSNGTYMREPGNPGGIEDDGFYIYHDDVTNTSLNRQGVLQHYWAWC